MFLSFFVAKSGIMWISYLYLNYQPQIMTPRYDFFGEYSCKLDAKGRLKLPAGLVEQLGGMPSEIIVNRGIENCLRMFSREAWSQKTKSLINRLNPDNSKQRKLARNIYRGVTKLSVDSNGRVLLPKSLMAYAGLDKEIIVNTYMEEIEIWSKDRYEADLEWDQDEYDNLSDEFLGGSITTVESIDNEE